MSFDGAQELIIRARRTGLTRGLLLAGVGALLGGLAVGLDRGAGLGLRFATVRSAELFVSSVLGAIITVTALLFWIRGMLVQLAAGEFSPRVVQWYLEDRFLMRSIGFLVGVFTFSGVVLVTMPPDDTAAAPAVTTVLALLLTVGALLSVVVAISNSVHTTDVSEILHRLAGRTVDHVRRQLPDPREHPSELRPPPPRSERGRQVRSEVVAGSTGWITHVDHDRLLELLADASSLRVSVSAGSFVTEGSHLGLLLAERLPRADVESVTLQLAECFAIGRRRVLGQDIALGIREILDVAVQSVAPGTNDATSAYEATSYLGVVVREILHRRLPQTLLRRDHDRVLVLEGELGYADYIDHSFGQLRQAASPTASVMSSLLATLGALHGELLPFGPDERTEALEREAGRILEIVEASGMTASDRASVQATAREVGLAGGNRLPTRPPSFPL